MDEKLTQAIARLVDRGFDLDTLTPDGIAVVRRGHEVVELRVEDGRVMMRGDIPRDLVPSPIPPTDGAASDLDADGERDPAGVTAPGMAGGSVGAMPATISRREVRRRRRRRRVLIVVLAVVLIAVLSAPLVLFALDRSPSDLWPPFSVHIAGFLALGVISTRSLATGGIHRERSHWLNRRPLASAVGPVADVARAADRHGQDIASS